MDQPPEEEAFGAEESKKSERKRQRERQRRNDIALAFSELATLVSKVDAQDDGSQSRRRRRRSVGEDDDQVDDASGMTRLDVIVRTIEAMRKLQNENAELKRRLEKSGGSRGGGVSWLGI